MNPKQYLWQSTDKIESCPSQIGNFEDAVRNHRDRLLTNDEIAIRINEQLQREAAKKNIEQDRSIDRIQSAWQKLLTTKLITKPCYL